MNDKLLFIIVSAGLVIWAAIMLGELVLKWYRMQRDVKGLFKGDIPVQYEKALKTAQERVNSSNQTSDHDAAMYAKLQDVRESVAHVRYAGYLAGERDHVLDRSFRLGVRMNPHRPKTGASRQWVRGYCMARNVLDPKPYMDQA